MRVQTTGGDEGVVVRWAVCSRVCLFVLSALSRAVVPAYDTSASISVDRAPGDSVTDAAVKSLFGGLGNWDAVYFLRVAEAGGYEFEQEHAFFPLLPAAIRFLSRALVQVPAGMLGISISTPSASLLAGVVITNVCFVLAAVALYRLTSKVVGKAVGLRAALLFTVNPSSIFFSAVYTESPFALCSFLGMNLALECLPTRGQERRRGKGVRICAVLSFICAGALRSNGLVLAGFFLYEALVRVVNRGRVGAICTAVGSALIVGLPFLAFSHYAAAFYCGGARGQVIGRPWCGKYLPGIYGFVQREYWNVGFLRYYELKQLPNFLLAAPAVAVAGAAARCGLRTACARKGSFVLAVLGMSDGPAPRVLDTRAVFLWHCTALAVVGVLAMHVQVCTRFLFAASPVMYWTVAAAKGSWLRRIVVVYFVGYFVVGAILFSTFYPWT